MSVDNFKPTLWEGALLANFHSVSVANAISTKPTSVEGEKITFNRVGSGKLKDYEGAVAWDDINTTPIEMTFPKKKYFAFSLDDVDGVQLKGDVMKETTQEHSSILAETYDQDFFLDLSGGAKSTNIIGSKTAPKSISSTNVYDYIVDLGVILGKNKVPKADRFVTVDSEILGLLSKDRRFTANPNVLANGIVEGQTIGTMKVVCTEEKPSGQIIAHHRGAIGAAKQLDKLEAMRLESSFSDGIRGLYRYGSKVLREESIAVMHYKVVPTDLMSPAKVVIANDETNPVHTKEVTPGA